MSVLHDIDFDVVREPWNKYSLHDGSYIKSRYILTKFRIPERDTQDRIQAENQGQHIVVAYNVPTNLKGESQGRPFSPEEINNANKEEVHYATIQEEWNEYILDDGTKIRIKDRVSRVFRTNLKDRNGDPTYSVEHSTIVQVLDAASDWC